MQRGNEPCIDDMSKNDVAVWKPNHVYSILNVNFKVHIVHQARRMSSPALFMPIPARNGASATN
jgi:hypothetical protein